MNFHDKTVSSTANGTQQAQDMHTIDQQKQRNHMIAKISIMSAIAFILMYLEFPVPLMPAFLKFDFSEIPALLAAFSMGPLAGVIVELVKNLLHLPFSQTMMVGELANFLIGASFVVAAGLVYQHHKSKQNAIKGMVLGTLTMTLVGALFNYFINIPFYINAMGFNLEAIVAMTNQAGNRLVIDLPSLILWVFVPFNIVKGALVSLLVSLLYKPLSPLLHR